MIDLVSYLSAEVLSPGMQMEIGPVTRWQAFFAGLIRHCPIADCHHVLQVSMFFFYAGCTVPMYCIFGPSIDSIYRMARRMARRMVHRMAHGRVYGRVACRT